MEIKELLNKINRSEKYKIGESVAVSQLTEIFYEGSISVHPLKMYVVLFNRIPHVVTKEKIDCYEACEWFIEKYESKIEDFYSFELPVHRFGHSVDYSTQYILQEDLMVVFNFTQNSVSIFFKETCHNIIEKILDGISKFKVKEQNHSRISLVVTSSNGLSTKSMEITKPKLSIADNYNEDFQEVHESILGRLNKEKDKGLVLLHGKPGTGKTSYIRYLITSVKKKVIFLPPNMASAITNPNLLTLLIENPNSIFIIEDAENIVFDREQNGASPVSALLNISDGLLSDCLNIQIVCSFNTDISKVDPALMRKGRLIAKYEFKELEVSKAQELSNKLGFKTKIDRSMTLTDIYNQSEKEYPSENRKSIGF